MVLLRKIVIHIRSCRYYSNIKTLKNESNNCPLYMQLSDLFEKENKTLLNDLINSMTVYQDFLTEEEETSLFQEVDPYMKRLRYEFDHWDDAIHGYRETERLHWNEKNTIILNRVKSLAFPPNVKPLTMVHVLDLDKKGYIKPHVDAVRFCGNTIAGLSLLSDSVMRLVYNNNKNLYANVLLKRRSLYIMKDCARYDYTHEILSNEHSEFNGIKVVRDRRISVICRNESYPKYK